MIKANKNLTEKGHIKYFEDQFDDEEVKYVFRRHPIVMRKGLIFGSLGLLAGPLYTLVLTYVNVDNPPTMTFFYLSFLASIVMCAVLFFPSWMSWYFTMFIVTSQRFIQITQKGFFSRNVSDINLNLIQSINYEIIGVEQTILSYGTIIMQTYVGDVHMHHIYHPARTSRRLADILRELGINPSDELVRNMRAEHNAARKA